MKDIDNFPTIWKAHARPYWKRLIRKIYIKLVGDAYIPRPKIISLVRERQKIHPQYGEITHIILEGDGYKVDGDYIFGHFGTEIIEHKLFYE